MSALNSGVNERRGRGFFRPTLSIMHGALPRGEPLIANVRQTGVAPVGNLVALRGEFQMAIRGENRWPPMGRISCPPAEGEVLADGEVAGGDVAAVVECGGGEEPLV